MLLDVDFLIGRTCKLQPMKTRFSPTEPKLTELLKVKTRMNRYLDKNLNRTGYINRYG